MAAESWASKAPEGAGGTGAPESVELGLDASGEVYRLMTTGFSCPLGVARLGPLRAEPAEIPQEMGFVAGGRICLRGAHYTFSVKKMSPMFRFSSVEGNSQRKPRVLWLSPQSLGSRTPAGLAAVFDVAVVHSVPEALLFLRTSGCDAVVVSCAEPDSTLDDALLEVHRTAENLPLLVDCCRVDVGTAVRLAKLGVCDVWSGRLDPSAVMESLRAAIEQASAARRTSAAPEREHWRERLVGESEAMRRILEVIRLVAARRSTVLITGETGTGKEVVARAIHAAGGRERLPFVAVNCGAIPENLIESELFGHAKGAFTGAVQSRAGKFEQASGGTIFLDEIGELPASMQVKLLRVLQEREVQRLGSNETIRLNVRVIAATNTDLEAAVARKEFREDLYYRLNVVPLHLPPLRERIEDLPLLVSHLLGKICAAEGLEPKTLSAGALARLAAHAWPGNIRQLEHAVEMAVVLSGDRPVLSECDFAMLDTAPASSSGSRPLVRVPDEGIDFDLVLAGIERSLVEQALAKSGGNKARAAELLRMKRTTLLAKLKSLGMLPEGSPPILGGGPQRVLAAAG